MAHSFEVDGIYYNAYNNEATVTFKGPTVNYYENEYSGSVTIPSSVTYDGETYLVTGIGNGAFFQCTNLKSVDIPNSVTEIGGSAFQECTSLTSIDIPNSVTSIDVNAFYYSGLTSVNIGNSVTEIGGSAFEGCGNLTSVNIGNSVTSIGRSAFQECTSLTSIDIPNSVTEIGDQAFLRCGNLTSVNIGNSVISIGNIAFSYCTSLTEITVNSGNSVYDSRNDCNAIIETASNKLIFGCNNTVIPNSVTAIGICAFYGSGLTSIDIAIPENVHPILDKLEAENDQISSLC